MSDKDPIALIPPGEIYDRLQKVLAGLPVTDAISSMSHVLINTIVNELLQGGIAEGVIVDARSQCQRVRLTIEVVNLDVDMFTEFVAPPEQDNEHDKRLS